MIKEHFHLDIPVFVISKIEHEDILNHAPEWWDDGNKEIYNNLIFIIPPESFCRIYKEIGEPKKELEKIESYKEVIF